MTITAETLEEHRTYLYRYALISLQDSHLAKDVVQETLLAAISGLDTFSGRSSARSWLTGILKHKIADCLRDAGRAPLVEQQPSVDEEDDFDAAFDFSGRWSEPQPQKWGDPESALESKKFWEVFDLCLSAMPTNMARVFVLREVMGDSIEEICKNFRISATNCSVMLYRARTRLRMCLDSKWFGNGQHRP